MLKPRSLAFTLLAAFVVAQPSFAGVSGVTFTEEEIAANAMNAVKISETGAACLLRHWNTHTAFHKERKYSKYYGNRNPKYKTPELRKQAILALLPELAKKVRKKDPAALAELDARERELENISCIGLALNCLGEGFKSAGMDATWQKIWDWIGRPGPDGTPLFYGTDLQKALVDLGWKSLYWNPDLSMNEEWDYLERAFNPLQDGKEWNPVWGGHVERWTSIQRKRSYFGIPVHDIRTLVNFGITPGSEFKKVPFYVGTAHAGYHVFPGMNGNVIEAHSMRELRSRENLEVGPFNPLYQPINGVQGGNGAPRWTRSEHYRSGVIVVPPGFLADKDWKVPPPASNTPPNGTIPPEDNGGPGWNDPRDPWNQPPPRRRRDRDCWFVFCR